MPVKRIYNNVFFLSLPICPEVGAASVFISEFLNLFYFNQKVNRTSGWRIWLHCARKLVLIPQLKSRSTFILTAKYVFFSILTFFYTQNEMGQSLQVFSENSFFFLVFLLRINGNCDQRIFGIEFRRVVLCTDWPLFTISNMRQELKSEAWTFSCTLLLIHSAWSGIKSQRQPQLQSRRKYFMQANIKIKKKRNK